MNAVIRSMAVSYGVPIVVDLLKDMVTPQGVVQFRQRVIALGEEITGQTPTEIDDRLWQQVASHILTPEGWKRYGAQFASWAKQYIINTETKYDDYALPVLTSLENAFTA